MRSSGPSQSRMGKRELRQRLTAVLIFCGHASARPSGVADQSFARIRAPSSPPPIRKAAPFATDDVRGVVVIATTCAGDESPVTLRAVWMPFPTAHPQPAFQLGGSRV